MISEGAGRARRAELVKFVVKRSDCAVPWKEMAGDERLRWCERCWHFVYNPAVLSDDELASLIWFREGIRPTVLFKRKEIGRASCRERV